MGTLLYMSRTPPISEGAGPFSNDGNGGIFFSGGCESSAKKRSPDVSSSLGHVPLGRMSRREDPRGRCPPGRGPPPSPRRVIFPMLRGATGGVGGNRGRGGAASRNGGVGGSAADLARNNSLPARVVIKGGNFDDDDDDGRPPSGATNSAALPTPPSPQASSPLAHPGSLYHPHARPKSDEQDALLLEGASERGEGPTTAASAKPTSRHARQRSDEKLLDALMSAPPSSSAAPGRHRKRGSRTTDELEEVAAAAASSSSSSVARNIGPTSSTGVASRAVGPAPATSCPVRGATSSSNKAQTAAPAPPSSSSAVSFTNEHPSIRPHREDSLFAGAGAAGPNGAAGGRAPAVPRTYYPPSSVPRYLDPSRAALAVQAAKKPAHPVSILRRSRSMPAHAQVSQKSVAVVAVIEEGGSGTSASVAAAESVNGPGAPQAPPTLARLSSTLSESERPSADITERHCHHDMFSPKPHSSRTLQVIDDVEVVQMPAAALLKDDGDGDCDGSHMRKIHSETCLVNHREGEVEAERRENAARASKGAAGEEPLLDDATRRQQQQQQQHPHRLTRHGSLDDRVCRTIRIDPRIWVFEYEPHEEERRNWFTVAELERFKFEAVARIQRSRSVRQMRATAEARAEQQASAAYYGGSAGTRLLPSGTGRVVRANVNVPPPPLLPQQLRGQQGSAGGGHVKALFSDPALGIDGEDEDFASASVTHLPSPRDAIVLRLLQTEIRNVLIIDPHEIFLSLFAKSIRSMMGHVIVTTARTAEEAQKRVEAARVVFPREDGGATHGFDVIVCEERLLPTSNGAAGGGGRRGRSGSMDDSRNGGGNGSGGEGASRHRSASFSGCGDSDATWAVGGGRGGRHQAAGDDQSQQRGPASSGSAFLGQIASEQREMERVWRRFSSSPWLASRLSVGSGGGAEPRPRFSLLVGVSARPSGGEGERLSRAGADFVWGKPPPSMDGELRNRLLKRILEKRGKSSDAVEVSSA